MPAAKKLLLLHGFTGAPHSWDAVREKLQLTLPIIAPTLTGHSDASGRQMDASRAIRTFDDELDRLLGLVEPATNGSVFVAGYSLGARLALGLLLRRRKLFAGALLIGVQPGLADDAVRRQRLAADRRWAELLAESRVAAFAAAWQQQALFETQKRLPARLLRAQTETRLRHSAAGLTRALQALGLGAMPCYTDRLGELELPIQLLVGDKDKKFRRIAETMRHKLPRCQLNIAPNAGHNLLLEAPKFVAEALRQGITDD